MKKNRHDVPTPLVPETVIVDTALGMIYRVGGESLALIHKSKNEMKVIPCL